jgi:acetyl esterase
MAVDPQVQAVVERLESEPQPAVDPEDHAAALAAGRAFHERSAPWLSGEGEPVASVEDLDVPTPTGALPLRVYRPTDEPGLPIVVYFHGGGWIVGTLDSYDAVLRALANASGAMVVSVGYRLAPESPFPGPVHDADAALAWAAEHGAEAGGDPARIAVAGDSAGGNLAAVAARRARDRGGPELRMQMLAYPATDAAMDSASYSEFADGPNLTREEMVLSWGLYLGDAPRADPDVSPLHAQDLSGLPPALVISAENDVLRDEGEAYAELLERAGVETQLSRYDGMAHGFFRWLAQVDASRAAMREAGRALARAMSA